MAKRTPIINDFRAGELTPITDARADQKDYYRGCRILEGMMPIIEGGVVRVPGTYYVRPVKQTEEGWCLRIIKSGDGSGTVASDIEGINCGSSCYHFFPDGTTVILTATPDGVSAFDGWSGEGYSGTSPISILMNGDKEINAKFHLLVDFRVRAITNDGIYLYLGGVKVQGSNYGFRVEKRNISDGVLVGSLDYTFAPTTTLKLWQDVKVDNDYVYLAGYYIDGSSQYHAIIDKIDKNLNGIVREYVYPSVGVNCIFNDICLDDDNIYFAGSKISEPVSVLRGRLTKSNLSIVWGAGGTISESRGITKSGDYIYIHKNVAGNKGIEKVAISDGTIVYDTVVGLPVGYLLKGEIDSGGNLYVAGGFSTGNEKATLGKISLAVPTSIWEVTYDVGGQLDLYHQAVIDASAIYVVGTSPYATRGRYASYDFDGNVNWQLSNDNPNMRGFCITQYGDYLYIPVEVPLDSGRMFYLEKRSKVDGSLLWAIP